MKTYLFLIILFSALALNHNLKANITIANKSLSNLKVELTYENSPVETREIPAASCEPITLKFGERIDVPKFYDNSSQIAQKNFDYQNCFILKNEDGMFIRQHNGSNTQLTSWTLKSKEAPAYFYIQKSSNTQGASNAGDPVKYNNYIYIKTATGFMKTAGFWHTDYSENATNDNYGYQWKINSLTNSIGEITANYTTAEKLPRAFDTVFFITPDIKISTKQITNENTNNENTNENLFLCERPAGNLNNPEAAYVWHAPDAEWNRLYKFTILIPKLLNSITIKTTPKNTLDLTFSKENKKLIKIKIIHTSFESQKQEIVSPNLKDGDKYETYTNPDNKLGVFSFDLRKTN